MPQYETEPAGADPAMVRARTPSDAVRQQAGLADGTSVEIGEVEAGSGWAEVLVDGAVWGRVRPRDRMRFRRD